MPPKRKAKTASTADDEPPQKQARQTRSKTVKAAAAEPADEDGGNVDNKVVANNNGDDETKPVNKQPRQSKAKKGGAAAATATATDDIHDNISVSTVPNDAPKVTDKPTNTTRHKDRLHIPIDDSCPLNGYRVYIDPSDSVIWDASLNQTNASSNNNKFHRIQLLHDGKGEYHTWTRWGRVGETGQGATLGNGSLDDAVRQFEKKFKEKSGLRWTDRDADSKSGKYVYIEKSYEPESEDERPQAKVGASRRSASPVKSTLAPPVRGLMELVFNMQYFEAVMASMNYDSNKLPLGKLSKSTILRGFSALKELSDLLDNPSLAASNYQESHPAAIEHLSNRFYSLIPHAWNRQQRPPVISTKQMLRCELDLLESLSDLKDANDIMKSEKSNEGESHPLDARFQGLGMSEMTALDMKSKEFSEISQYLLNTCGATHTVSYKVEDIFRIERKGEGDRFETGPYANIASDRRLLWHGSRTTNYGGILSQGLRIAPPEAPVSGYMFDKGIYLADMSSKSANYCYSYLSGGSALLLLCEAELGNPIQVLQEHCYNAAETAKQQGMYSTWGQGTTGPKAWKDAKCVHPSLAGVKMPDTSEPPGQTNVKNASLLYNEYICYDVAQVKLRYLLRVRI